MSYLNESTLSTLKEKKMELNMLSQEKNYFKKISYVNKLIDLCEKYLLNINLISSKVIDFQEINQLKNENESLEQEFKEVLLEREQNFPDNCIVEIRAGTGGEEASIFAMDLFRMYVKFAEIMKWEVEVLDISGDKNSVKTVIFLLKGKNSFKTLFLESGVHRVQRIPATEAKGRIHTSTATVAILPEAEEAELIISDKDIRVDVFRSSGAGGQSVNKTESAVRITHLPSGIVVQCQDERSQKENKDRAMKILRARLLQKLREEESEIRSSDRKKQIGSAQRYEKIKTYNYPENRLTDHRYDIKVYSLDRIMQGNLKEILQQIFDFWQRDQINNLSV